MEFLKSILNWVKKQINKFTTLIGFGNFFEVTTTKTETVKGCDKPEDVTTYDYINILSCAANCNVKECLDDVLTAAKAETDSVSAYKGLRKFMLAIIKAGKPERGYTITSQEHMEHSAVLKEIISTLIVAIEKDIDSVEEAISDKTVPDSIYTDSDYNKPLTEELSETKKAFI